MTYSRERDIIIYIMGSGGLESRSKKQWGGNLMMRENLAPCFHVPFDRVTEWRKFPAPLSGQQHRACSPCALYVVKLDCTKQSY